MINQKKKNKEKIEVILSGETSRSGFTSLVKKLPKDKKARGLL